jgi:N-acylneuraminate cytidylyltransferase
MPLIAIIPARGGSKRIDQKNIRDFRGNPIICYSIKAAIDSQIFTEVMVSTDDREIADIALSAGAAVPFYRSEEAANEYATVASALLEVLSEYEKIGKLFTHACLLYPTAPFVTAENLRTSYLKFCESGADSLLPVVRYSHPPQRSFLITNEGLLRYRYPEFTDARSQDLSPWYHDAGQYCFFDVEKFRVSKSLLGENCVPTLISELYAHDIDCEDDWAVAEKKYSD